jgi:nucleotide-binding universal stress UspA family protein
MSKTEEYEMKILLAVDGSDYTRRMLDYIVQHTRTFGGDNQFIVLNTVLALPHRAAAFAGPDVVQAYYADDARTVLGPIRAFLEQHDIEASYVHKVGHPAGEIARYAEEGKFDMVVMGSHGYNALKNLVLGSVATQVLAACSVPVLIVR